MKQTLLYTLSFLPAFFSYALGAPPTSGPAIQIRESKVSLPFAIKLNAIGKTLPEIDRNRIENLLQRSKNAKSNTNALVLADQSSVPVVNQAVTYVASVGVGNPPTNYSLLIDTGSSNTWIGAGKSYVHTCSSNVQPETMLLLYGSGVMFGLAYKDDVTLGNGLDISQQEIGDADFDLGFNDIDGILGIGPTNLTEGTEFPGTNHIISTVTDNLFSQGKISTEVVGIYFAPTTTDKSANGEMTFGGFDDSKITQDIEYVNKTSTSPASQYWGIDQNITYGSAETNILSAASGIVDTGTTLLYLATDGFDAYVAATGATTDQSTGLLTITPENYANLQSLFFQVGGSTFEFTRDAQTWPRSLNTFIGGTTDNIYLVVADLGSQSGQGLDFINGYTFLERFYSAYDTTNQRVGLATTINTNVIINYNSTS